ncbi:MAG: iron ABC transporter permease [Planctomycetes bacterium]|nr:iron ABC transporter permease [Planctomycetota bacterium]
MRSRGFLLGLAAIATLSVGFAPSWGSVSIDALAEGKRWLGPRDTWTSSTRIFELRLARIALAFLAGGALACAGAVLQTLLRNGLATPFTLGVASAGSFGAFLVLAFPTAWFAIHLGATFSALAFALGSLALVLALARRSQRVDSLLLAGITLNFLFGAGVMLVRYLADPLRLAAMERWMLGSVEALYLSESLSLLPWVAAPLLLLLLFANELDQLAFDENLAATRGVSVTRVRNIGLLAAGLLTASVVARTGPIGFIGLLVPHAVRFGTGLQHRQLLIGCFLAGGTLLVLADLLARSVSIGGRSSELPVGILTALVGGPCFLALLLRRSTR